MTTFKHQNVGFIITQSHKIIYRIHSLVSACEISYAYKHTQTDQKDNLNTSSDNTDEEL